MTVNNEFAERLVFAFDTAAFYDGLLPMAGLVGVIVVFSFSYHVVKAVIREINRGKI